MVALSNIFNIFRRKSGSEEVRDLSSDHLEQDLSPSLMERVRTHIDNCGPCNSFVSTLTSTVELLTEMGRKEPPSQLKSSILKRVEEEPNDPS
jgi:hypothetical protein